MVQTLDGAAPMTRAISLVELWHATPETPSLPDRARGWRPLVLHRPPYEDVRAHAATQGSIELAVDGISLDLAESELNEALSHYPTLFGGVSVRSSISDALRNYYATDRPQVTYSPRARILDHSYGRPWLTHSPVLTWSATEDQDAAFAALGPIGLTSSTDARLVEPSLGGSERPSPVALWWALLLALSSLVRYEPAVWTEAIDPDRSRLAVPLEQVCDFAVTLIPSTLVEWNDA
jgi:hypothetical protein